MKRGLAFRHLFSVPASIGIVAISGPSEAETLVAALRSAYATNPNLLEQRADQHALDETVVQARSGWLPTMSVQITTQYQRTDLGRLPYSGAQSSTDTNELNAQVIASQPLYTGGRVKTAVDAAEADVRAGRDGVRAGENQLLERVVETYADVRRDEKTVAIRQESLLSLESELAEAQAKASVGQLTRVDVAQAQGQLAASRVELHSAEAQLRTSQAAYTALVGHAPENLAPPADLPGVPTSLSAATSMARESSPQLAQAEDKERASRFRLEQARAERRPSLTLQGSFGPTGPAAPFDTRNFDRNLTGALVFSQPLFTGGLTSSRVRQALQRDTSDRIAIEVARRNVDEVVSQAWSALTAAQANVKAGREEVAAQQIAFEGIREQYRVGLTTTTDVLTQEERLRVAQLSLASAEHDIPTNQAALLAEIGNLDVLITLAETR